MKYFNRCKTLEELKKEFRRLAMLHHPDRDGDTETMKGINAEYDVVFPVLKLRTGNSTTETAKSTRSEFYTANGWKGDNYDASLTLKEIAQIVRAYVKEAFPDYRFSVRTSYASMCQELHVDIKEAPCPALKTIDELTADDVHEIIRAANHWCDWTLDNWSDEEARAEILRLWKKYPRNQFRIVSDRVKAVAAAVDAFVNSYNYDDSDGMIDYFDNNFYYFGCLQDPAAVKVVPREPRKDKAEQGTRENCTESANKPAELPALRVEFNAEFDGVEVYFPSKPSEETRTALKVAGFRWHSQKKCWYGKRTEERLQALRKIEQGAA